MITRQSLQRLAEIRKRDAELYRTGALQVREDIHFLLAHIDELLSFADDKEGAANDN